MKNLTDISYITNVMKRNGFHFSKSLGQNFIVNPAVCPKIASMGVDSKEYGVIEIGTGVGVLTQQLALVAKKVVAIEIDSKLMPVLEETLEGFDNIKIINDDIMKVDLHRIIEEEFPDMPVAVCANLPYYITSPIIMNLMEQNLNIKSVTVMVQKEAGLRLTAPLATREVGAVTFAVRFYSEPKILFNVSRGSFIPSPNVDSCVVRFDIFEKSPYEQVEDKDFLFRVIKGGFSQRRKTLCNSLSGSLGISKSLVGQALQQSGLSGTVRPEQMKMEDFIKLSGFLKELLK